MGKPKTKKKENSIEISHRAREAAIYEFNLFLGTISHYQMMYLPLNQPVFLDTTGTAVMFCFLAFCRHSKAGRAQRAAARCAAAALNTLQVTAKLTKTEARFPQNNGSCVVMEVVEKWRKHVTNGW
ncbi:hypothetical protein AOLI_G00185120 [Acnodon oligacanthus]